MHKALIGTLVMLSIVVYGCGPSPEDVGKQFQDALNSGDIDTALGLLDDEAVVDVDGTRAGTGKAEIEEWLSAQAKLNFQLEGTSVAIDSGVVIEDCSIKSDIWSYFELGSMTAICEIGVAGTDITSFVVQFDDSSKDRLSESPAASDSELIGIWRTRNYLTDSGELYLEFLEDGTGRLIGSMGGSIPDHGVEFEGASLNWTYENFILTIQNAGPASEKYCSEKDVGTFLVKNVDAGGLKFKLLGDTCALRGVAIPLPPRWIPNVP